MSLQHLAELPCEGLYTDLTLLPKLLYRKKEKKKKETQAEVKM